jgi:two-component system, NtrC family, response regulator AtoC
MTTATRRLEAQAILVVEDDEEVGNLLLHELARYGKPVHLAATLDAAREYLQTHRPPAIFLDIRLPDGDGLEILAKLRESDLSARVAVLTAYADVELAVRAIRLGASDFLEKPFTREQLHVMARSLLSSPAPTSRGSERRKRQVPTAFFVGDSPALQDAAHRVNLAASAPTTTVLITGESGTGKELAARAVHNQSLRGSGPFVAINCAALTESLLEAELFGYERGAFTGATTGGKKGLFEVANGGTMFLDEIGEMERGLQAKLLRVLQERTIKRVGGLTEIPIDVRIVASTNRDLESEIRAGTFRKDLFYRLNVLKIVMPPLRDRGEDVILLAQHFLKVISLELGRTLEGFTSAALEVLRAYPWPGNVREMRNVIEHSVIVTRGNSIDASDLSIAPSRDWTFTETIEVPDLKIENVEKVLIRKALVAAKGQKTRAAELLGINRATLYNKLKAYGITTEVRAQAISL